MFYTLHKLGVTLRLKDKIVQSTHNKTQKVRGLSKQLAARFLIKWSFSRKVKVIVLFTAQICFWFYSFHCSLLLIGSSVHLSLSPVDIYTIFLISPSLPLECCSLIVERKGKFRVQIDSMQRCNNNAFSSSQDAPFTPGGHWKRHFPFPKLHKSLDHFAEYFSPSFNGTRPSVPESIFLHIHVNIPALSLRIMWVYNWRGILLP